MFAIISKKKVTPLISAHPFYLHCHLLPSQALMEVFSTTFMPTVHVHMYSSGNDHAINLANQRCVYKDISQLGIYADMKQERFSLVQLEDDKKLILLKNEASGEMFGFYSYTVQEGRPAVCVVLRGLLLHTLEQSNHFEKNNTSKLNLATEKF